MSAALEDYYRNLRRMEIASINASLKLLARELNLDDPKASVTALMNDEETLLLAARDLTRAVDELPVTDRPKGWAA